MNRSLPSRQRKQNDTAASPGYSKPSLLWGASTDLSTINSVSDYGQVIPSLWASVFHLSNGITSNFNEL